MNAPFINVNFFFLTRVAITTIIASTKRDKLVAIAAPATPRRGKPKFPKMRKNV